MYNFGLRGGRYQTMTFDNYRPKTKLQSEAWEKMQSKSSFILYGGVGVGKTHLAVSFVKERREEKSFDYRVSNCVYVDLYTIFKLAKRFNDSESIFKKYKSTPFLVIDEVGSVPMSDFEHSVLFNLIDHRYAHEKHIGLITNLSLIRLKMYCGERISDRLRGWGDLNIINVDGKSHRQQ